MHNIKITNDPQGLDELITAKTREFNQPFVRDDYAPLCVSIHDDSGQLIGGLSGKTGWNYLDVGFLWVHENHRRSGIGSEILEAAEGEARHRGCGYAMLDTYSFQALPFYTKHGYHIYGEIDGYCEKHTRYFLRKNLNPRNL